jgi:orotate phosphoribosyltransferase
VSAITESTLQLFEATEAYLKGHFRLTSGLHSPEYLQSAKVLQHPQHAERLGAELGDELARLGPIDVVVSPALGGLIIGHEVARRLGVRHIFTERDAAGRMTLRRGFAVAPGERAAVVEDVITTGGSTREVIELLLAQGARITGAGSIIDRSGGAANVGVPRLALATLTVTAWPPESCPLCAAGVPVVKPGSRQS